MEIRTICSICTPKLGGRWSILTIIVFKWVVQTPTRWSLNVFLCGQQDYDMKKNCSCCLLKGRYVKWNIYSESNLLKFEFIHIEEADLMEPKLLARKPRDVHHLFCFRAFWRSVLHSPSCSTASSGWRQVSAWSCFGHSWTSKTLTKPDNALIQTSGATRCIRKKASLCWWRPLVRVCV